MASSVSSPREHHRRGFSFGSKSSKSHRRSSSSGNNNNHHHNDIKVDLPETAEEKARRHLRNSSKADPTVAMSELQPMAVALEKSNLGNLREIQHKDQYGNLITDPDPSNPTRPRMERPLETIRSFEAAIYGPVSSTSNVPSRPGSFVRSRDDSPGGDYSRRSSYFGAHDFNRYPSRRESYYPDNYGPDNFYPYNQGYQGPSYNQVPRRPRPSHRMTDSSFSSPRAYNNGYQHSYDDFSGSGSGSGHTQPSGNSTAPSSVNSSFDQLQQQSQIYQQQQYEMSTAGGPSFGYDRRTSATPPPRHVFGAPAPDPNAGGPVGGPVGGGPVGGSSQPPAAAAATAPPGNRRHLRKSTNMTNGSEANTDGKESKRKSWFKRKFSKS